MSNMKPSIDQLLVLIESKEEELIQLTQALVRIPTINPPGDYYGDCIELWLYLHIRVPFWYHTCVGYERIYEEH